MNKTINFSKFFLPAAVISCALIAIGITGYFTKGFTLGVDFKSGLIQEVQIAPAAVSLKYHGTYMAAISFSSSDITIVITGSGIENQTNQFLFSRYTTIGSLVNAMNSQIEGLEASVSLSAENASTQSLVFSSVGNPRLNADSHFIIHYLPPNAAPIDVSEVRTALAGIGNVSVQSAGDRHARQFLIRSDSTNENEGARNVSSQILSSLESFFGENEVAVLRTDFVDQRFSALTVSTSLRLLVLTLLVILIYASIRFKPKFAVGAVLAIIHDGIIVVSFVVWTQMEFTTSTIAAILTILGYSINNTIVVFDRIRENNRLFPEKPLTEVLNISLNNVLGRSIITTLTTILAVLFLFVFAKGAMKDFALALMVGMISGVYTSLFISTGFVNFLDNFKSRKKTQITAN